VFREVAREDTLCFDPDGDPDRIAEAVLTRLELDPAWRLRRRVTRDDSWAEIYAGSIEPLLAERRAR